MEKRPYALRKRARKQEATRRRIVEATAALHEELGPSRTTISAVAARAGVQRLTVYRHFPGEAELFAACAAHQSVRHPPPDPARWADLENPRERAETAIAAVHAYYRAGAEGLSRVLRDAESLPALREALAPMGQYLERVAEDVGRGWDPAPEARTALRAAVAHALDFWSWRSLAREGLDPRESARLMTCLISAAAERD